MSTTDPTQSAIGMPCPRCRVDLLMSERQGIEIDYCPKCRGIWLDRGELDKMIERSEQQAIAAMQPQAPAAPPQTAQGAWTPPNAPPPGWSQQGSHGGGHGSSHGGGSYGKPSRRRSWLGELFD